MADYAMPVRYVFEIHFPLAEPLGPNVYVRIVRQDADRPFTRTDTDYTLYRALTTQVSVRSMMRSLIFIIVFVQVSPYVVWTPVEFYPDLLD